MRQLTSEQARDMAAKRANPGRKRKADEDELKALMDAELPPAEFVRIFARGTKSGKEAFVRLWAAYRFGEPVKKSEVSGPDGEALIINIVRQDDPALPGAT